MGAWVEQVAFSNEYECPETLLCSRPLNKCCASFFEKRSFCITTVLVLLVPFCQVLYLMGIGKYGLFMVQL